MPTSPTTGTMAMAKIGATLARRLRKKRATRAQASREMRPCVIGATPALDGASSVPLFDENSFAAAAFESIGAGISAAILSRGKIRHALSALQPFRYRFVSYGYAQLRFSGE